MEKKTHLTNEFLAKKYKNNFDLVLHAIHMAEEMIKSGRGPRVKTTTENKAMIVLEEIAEGKDILVAQNHDEDDSDDIELEYDLPETYIPEDAQKEQMVVVKQVE